MTSRFLTALIAFSANAATLSNGSISAKFDARGLVSLGGYHVAGDGFSLTLDGQTFDSDHLPPPQVRPDQQTVRYDYRTTGIQIEVAYELQPGWRFLSKQLKVELPSGKRARVDRLMIFRTTMADQVRELYPCSHPSDRRQTRDCGGFLRFDDVRGLLAVVQNPFLDFRREGNVFTVAYAPEMDWEAAWGPFVSDRGLLAPYTLTGRKQPARMLPEWKLAPFDDVPGMDDAEVEAYTECVRAFITDRVPRPVNVFVGWCVNDYQIDIATPEGRAEYKRVIDRAAEMGAGDVLFAPTNTALALRAQSEDDWGWENLLWLGLGQRIRRGEWKIGTDPIPATVAEMLAYARAKNVGLLAYVYPVLGFLADQHPDWTVAGKKPARNDLGVRAYQDWLTDALVAFARRTGITGYSFDHAFLNYEGTSRYAQWAGWRRVMEKLRERMPNLVIDGRQAYQDYGPWSWLAGTYPHPTHTDEQPESFVPFPDLHFDRVSANRERYTAWRYRNMEFAPSELVPGFITHQTPRLDDKGELPVKRMKDERTGLTEELPVAFRTRDWDYLGWRYSLLSSIAVGGLNNVIDMIPARDLEEYGHFSAAQITEFRGWLQWAADNREYLQRTRSIIGQPAIGRVDGTAAIRGDRGFVFLFNPNGRRLDAVFRLDASIGLTGSGRFVVREIYPVAGRFVGGFFKAGDVVTIPLDGTSATVFEVTPANAALATPMLFGASGRARMEGKTLELTEVRGEVGTSVELTVVTPAPAEISTVRVNGQPVPFTVDGALVRVTARFGGVAFHRSQQVKDRLSIPQRIFDQLAERRRRWPIVWTQEDYQSTWLVPERLLLFVQIAEPSDAMAVSLKLDGSDIKLEKAYSSVRRHSPSFVGFYADVSALRPNHEYRVDLTLPQLRPGQFQGLFFDNVETEYTGEIIQ